MEMFLILMIVGLLTVAVSAVLLLASTRPPAPAPPPREQLLKLPSRFFADDRAPRSPHAVPIEVLLLQIERHVRLEQAAAEAFRDMPTTERLWAATVSPLVH